LSIIAEIAREMKLDLVLNRDSSLIFLPHLNISDEVLTRLNERTKNARIEIEVQQPQSQ
jgi:Skp family chaperone for outer membrane proteins